MVSKAYYAREVASYADVETYKSKAHNVIILKTQRSIDFLYLGVFLIVTAYNLINHWVHYSISVYPVCCCSTFAIAPIQLTLIARRTTQKNVLRELRYILIIFDENSVKLDFQCFIALFERICPKISRSIELTLN